MPKTAPQMIPNPQLATKYGQRISSPLPNPKPKRTKLGPIKDKNDSGAGMAFIPSGFIKETLVK